MRAMRAMRATRAAAVKRPRSLFLRLVLGFALPASAIWLALAGWAVIDALRGGQQAQEKGLTDYSRQVLAVAHIFQHEPERLAQAITQIEALDNGAQAQDSDGADRPRIQVWLNERLLNPVPGLPSGRPDPAPAAYRELAPQGERGQHWASVVQSDGAGVTVRVAVPKTAQATLLWPSLGLVVAPLLVSLPLLLIPAWLMTRKGLQPLGTLVAEIGQRAASGELTRLPPVGYRELQPVIDAMNRLLDRLDSQLQRERTFVTDVAHEMKTPLAILRTNLDILRNSRDGLRRAAAGSDLDIGLDRASHLIGQLLRMARLDGEVQPAQAREVDLAEFVRQRVALLVPLADARGQTLDVEMPDSITGCFDVEAVGAVVDNLIDNAIKYADRDSVIHVRLGADLPASAILFAVQDQGPGIAPALYGQALARFGRAGHHDAAGAGLGLAIVQRAAHRLGGALTLSAAPGRPGLCAEVGFPGLMPGAGPP